MPNVSFCEDGRDLHYNPYVEPPFFCKLTLNDGSVVNIEGSGELTSAMTASHKAACVSAEVGELCESIGGYAFQSCSGLTSVIIGSGVTSIGFQAFNDCTSLSSVTIPNTVTSIGDGAFFSCSGLTSVTIPNTVTSIGSSTFNRCSGLANIEIPSSVTSIGNYAFGSCGGLSSVTVKATTPPTLGGNAFSNNASGRKIYVPSGSVDAYKATSKWSTYASDIQAIQ